MILIILILITILINIITLTSVIRFNYRTRLHSTSDNYNTIKTYRINHLIINYLDGSKAVCDDNATVVIFEDNCTIIPDNQ